MLPEERAWKFDRGMWGEVEEKVFRLVGTAQANDLDHALSLAGYRQEPIIQLGDVDEHGLSAEVYGTVQGAAPDYTYYVVVSLGDATECVYIVDFPSLVMFLGQFGAIFGGLFFGGVR